MKRTEIARCRAIVGTKTFQPREGRYRAVFIFEGKKSLAGEELEFEVTRELFEELDFRSELELVISRLPKKRAKA